MTAETVSEIQEAPAWLRADGVFLRGLPRGRYPPTHRMAWWSPSHEFAADFAFEGRPIRFWCDLRNSLAPAVLFLGSYEPQETLLLRALLGPGDTCVDVGAHWGYGKLRDPSVLLKSFKDEALDAWPYLLASREADPFA